jgi:hypothetical protein
VPQGFLVGIYCHDKYIKYGTCLEWGTIISIHLSVKLINPHPTQMQYLYITGVFGFTAELHLKSILQNHFTYQLSNTEILVCACNTNFPFISNSC